MNLMMLRRLLSLTFGITCVSGIGISVYALIVLSGAENTYFPLCPEVDIWTWLVSATTLTILTEVGLLFIWVTKNIGDRLEDTQTIIGVLIVTAILFSVALWGCFEILDDCALDVLRGEDIWYAAFAVWMYIGVVLGMIAIVAVWVAIYATRVRVRRSASVEL